MATRSRRQADGRPSLAGQPGRMTNNPHLATEAHSASDPVSWITITRQISPSLSALALALAAAGIATGLIRYLHRSPISEAHVPGTSAWLPQIIVAVATCALYGVARWRHDRRFGRGSRRLLLLAPLGRSGAARLTATMRRLSWRSVAALPLIALIGYCFWRTGEQVTGGLDPNFTVNAWGGPTYLGAMACHYLDCGLGIGVSAWLLDVILLPAAAGACPAAG
jgi:hypothetical protein